MEEMARKAGVPRAQEGHEALLLALPLPGCKGVSTESPPLVTRRGHQRPFLPPFLPPLLLQRGEFVCNRLGTFHLSHMISPGTALTFYENVLSLQNLLSYMYLQEAGSKFRAETPTPGLCASQMFNPHWLF